MKRLRNLYVWIVDRIKILRIILIVLFILITIYLLINAFVNYSILRFFWDELTLTILFGSLILIVKLFHTLYGKWFVLERRQEETDEYVRKKFPRSVKFDGPRGAGKDSTVSAMTIKFREDLIARIVEEMEYIRKICYVYDFDQINAFLDVHHDDFMTNSKVKLFQIFTTHAQENGCWIRPGFLEGFSAEEHLRDLDQIRANPKSLMASAIRFRYYDGISYTHFLTMLIRYSLLYVRYHFIPNYVFTNQPI